MLQPRELAAARTSASSPIRCKRDARPSSRRREPDAQAELPRDDLAVDRQRDRRPRASRSSSRTAGAMVVARPLLLRLVCPAASRFEILDGETAAARARCPPLSALRASARASWSARRSDGRRHLHPRPVPRNTAPHGVLYEQMKFCEYWSYERALGEPRHHARATASRPSRSTGRTPPAATASCARACRHSSRAWRSSSSRRREEASDHG